MANEGDADFIVRLLGARPEDLVQKRYSEIAQQENSAFPVMQADDGTLFPFDPSTNPQLAGQYARQQQQRVAQEQQVDDIQDIQDGFDGLREAFREFDQYYLEPAREAYASRDAELAGIENMSPETRSILRLTAAALATGEILWNDIPEDIQHSVQRLMQSPVIDALVAGSEHFVNATDVPTGEAALGGLGVAARNLVTSIPQRLSDNPPAPRSFSEIEGMPMTAGLIADLLVGGGDALADTALFSRSVSRRLPEALTTAEDLINDMRYTVQVNQQHKRAWTALSETPGLEHLDDETFENIVEAALRYGDDPDGLRDFLEGWLGIDPNIAQKAADAIAPLGLEQIPLPPARNETLGLLPFGRASRGNDEIEGILDYGKNYSQQFGVGDYDAAAAAISRFNELVSGDGRPFPITEGDDDFVINFGPSTKMTLNTVELPDGRRAVYVNSLYTSRPNSGGGLRLDEDQRQILSLFDILDAYGIPSATSPAAYSHRNLSTTQLTHMYNRLGFSPTGNGPLMIREPLPIDTKNRFTLLKERIDPELEAAASDYDRFSARIREGKPPTVSELMLEANPNGERHRAATMFADSLRDAGVADSEIDEASYMVGLAYANYRSPTSSDRSDTIASLADTLEIPRGDAEMLIRQYGGVMRQLEIDSNDPSRLTAWRGNQEGEVAPVPERARELIEFSEDHTPWLSWLDSHFGSRGFSDLSHLQRTWVARILSMGRGELTETKVRNAFRAAGWDMSDYEAGEFARTANQLYEGVESGRLTAHEAHEWLGGALDNDALLDRLSGGTFRPVASYSPEEHRENLSNFFDTQIPGTFAILQNANREAIVRELAPYVGGLTPSDVVRAFSQHGAGIPPEQAREVAETLNLVHSARQQGHVTNAEVASYFRGERPSEALMDVFTRHREAAISDGPQPIDVDFVPAEDDSTIGLIPHDDELGRAVEAFEAEYGPQQPFDTGR